MRHLISSPTAIAMVGQSADSLPKELPPVDGVLSLDAFKGRVITIGWTRDRIGVWPSGTEPQATAVTPHRAATGENGRYLTVFVPIKATRGLLWYLLDSGNPRGTLVAESAIKDGLLLANPTGEMRLSIATRPEFEMT